MNFCQESWSKLKISCWDFLDLVSLETIIMLIISIFFWINFIFKVMNFLAFNLKCCKKLLVAVKNWKTNVFLVDYLRFSFLISFECRLIWTYLIFFLWKYILRWNNIDLFTFNLWVLNWNILKNFNLIIFQKLGIKKN